MTRIVPSIAGLLLLLTAACADVATTPDRVPTELRIADEMITTTVGETVHPLVTVLDQSGDAMEVPQWAGVRWSVSAPAVLDPAEEGVLARSPGSAIATATVAGLETDVTVRVNPEQLRLRVAQVRVTQEGNSGSELHPGQDARLDAFVTGDEVNFFQPNVRLTVVDDGEVLRVVQMRRPEESVPLSYDPADPETGWSTMIPGELIQPGVELYVEADPEATISRGPGSSDRFPAEGTFALDVGAAALQVTILGAHLTQSVQTFDGTVPLVAGRDALLRVFVTAGEFTTYGAAVRATFYRLGVPVHTLTLHRGGSIPLQLNATLLNGSWNATIPGDWLVPGLSMVVEVDPQGAFGFKPGSVARFPTVGVRTLDVRQVSTLRLRMIPIHQSSMGTTGDISGANLASYVAAATAKFPLATVEAELRTSYSTSTVANTEFGWQQILREIAALQTAEGSSSYYYGVLRHPGGSNIGGMGYIGWPAAIGYDRMPQAPETFAHELGHNFGLLHAPCGGATGVDSAFPYADGSIGVIGYDLASGNLKLPTVQKDLMSYCGPEWISDYNYLRTLNFRERSGRDVSGGGAGNVPAAAAGVKEEALLVWGGVQGGRLVLEPAFELAMAPKLPSGTGEYRIQGFDAQGIELFSYRFDPAGVDHANGGSSFAFSIPARLARTERLERLRLSGPEGEVVRSRPAVAPPPSEVEAETRGPRVALSWRPAGRPMALVRDRVTGEILSFARGGALVAADRPVEVFLSDGVRSQRVPLENP